jgi:hypothetical protein
MVGRAAYVTCLLKPSRSPGTSPLVLRQRLSPQSARRVDPRLDWEIKVLVEVSPPFERACQV